MRLALLDTNLLLVLIVGRANLSYLQVHKRTVGYDRSDYQFIEKMVAAYDGLVTMPHILAEASSLLRQIGNPARDVIQGQFRLFIRECRERFVASVDGCGRDEFLHLGLTDAILLEIFDRNEDNTDTIELLTADEPIYNRARSLDLPAELYA